MADMQDGGAAAAFLLAQPRPLIPEDAGTVAHVWFKNGTLIDTRGNTWTQNGTVPQVPRSGRTPAGAGPFSDANFYSLGTGNDVLDFAGDFSAAIVFGPSVLNTTNKVLFSNGTGGVDGYYIERDNGSAGQIAFRPLGQVFGVVASAVNVIVFGKSGANGAQQLNLGTYTSGALSLTPATTTVARLGRYSGANVPALSTTIYEAWFSTTAISSALASSIANRVKSRAGVTQW